jgi:hypothetical protein
MDIKLKCIKSIRYLTQGKYYRVIPSMRSHDDLWVYEDDLRQGGWYSKDFFQTVEDNRNDKINQIVK